MKKSKKNYSSIKIATKPDSTLMGLQYLHYKNTCCKYYFNAQHLFLGLTDKERSFYDFLCEKMDIKNRVLIDQRTKNEFINFIKKITGNRIVVSIPILDKATGKLKERNLILNIENNKGYYIVNPRYAFGGTEKSRMELIKNEIENRMVNEIKYHMLIDIPLNDLLGKKSNQ